MRIYVSEGQPNYRVYFQRDSKEYYVSFLNNSQKLRATLEKRHPSTQLTYHYVTNYEIKLTKPTLIAKLISVIFLASFFTRSNSMTGGVKNNTSGAGLSNQILGQKKSFDIITKTKVRFRDVAGLDESKMEVQ